MPNTIDTYSRHAHYLEQYFNGQANKINPFLRRIAKKLRLELTKTETVISKNRTEALLKFTEQLVNSELKEFTEDLSGQIELFAVSEAAFAVERGDGKITVEDLDIGVGLDVGRGDVGCTPGVEAQGDRLLAVDHEAGSSHPVNIC